MAAPISTSFDAQERAIALDFILQRVSAGDSVAQALKQKPGFALPAHVTFWSWHQRDPQLQNDLARARLNGVEVHVDAAVDILDGNDLERNPDGTLLRPEDAYLMDTQRAKARAHIRLKRAEMIAPRKYGPKLDLTTDGNALPGNAPSDAAEKVVTIIDQVAKRIGTTPATIDQRTLDLLE